MKLVTCLYEGKERVGALMERGVAFLPFPDMNTLIETADPARLTAGEEVPLASVTLLEIGRASGRERVWTWV